MLPYLTTSPFCGPDQIHQTAPPLGLWLRLAHTPGALERTSRLLLLSFSGRRLPKVM
jgi:hypothetical protein